MLRWISESLDRDAFSAMMSIGSCDADRGRGGGGSSFS
jgi:hypothetical protein